MRTWLPILHVMGLMSTLFSFTFLLPIGTSLYYGDGTVWQFVGAMGITFTIGVVLWLATKPFKRELRRRDGFLLVVLMWLGIALIGSLPLMWTIESLSFTDAFFESLSGLTTTAATVLTGLDHLPPAVNIWRHELIWLGGMGIIVLAVAVLPMLGVGGMQLYKAETPGPMKDSKLTPRITETAKALWLIYFALTLICIVALRIAGMDWFDAVNHGFATLSLGGFSTHDASIGHFDSPAIEAVIIAFMLVGALNYANHFLFWHRRSLRIYAQDSEGLVVLTLILGSVIMIAGFLWWRGIYPEFATALRYASFNVISIATTCGFTSVDYGQWPAFAPLWMLFLSAIAVSSGSTGGGIKMIRTMLLYKQANRELFRLLHPQSISAVKVAGRVVPNNVVVAVLGFIFLYFMSVVVLSFTLMASGLEFVTALSAVIACINNAGPGLNEVGPATNYASLTDFQTWVCAAAMLLGRLEIFSVLILFTPAYWRK